MILCLFSMFTSNFQKKNFEKIIPFPKYNIKPVWDGQSNLSGKLDDIWQPDDAWDPTLRVSILDLRLRLH